MHPSAVLAHNAPYVQQLELGGQYRDPRSWSVLTKEPYLLLAGYLPTASGATVASFADELKNAMQCWPNLRMVVLSPLQCHERILTVAL